MSIIKADKTFETGAPPDPKLMVAIEKLTAEMMSAGVVLDIGGLLPSALGAKVYATGGKLSVKDGPFTEAKELIGGYAVLQVKSKEEAIELGKKFMQAHIDALGASYEGELEVRQMFDPTDMPCSPHPKS